MQLEQFPGEEELDSAYADAESFDYVAEEAGQRATASKVLERIERFAAPPGRFLDLGCWVGFLLAEASERGWEAQGVEPSAFASRFARERLGLDVETAGLFDAVLEPAAFRAVFLGDVLEHLIDPVGALIRVGELLEPGGVVAMTLPDAGSRIAKLMGDRWWSVIPTHVHYFTRSSVAEAMSRAGFTPVVAHTAPKAFTVRYYLGRISGYSASLSGGLISIAEQLGLVGRLWTPDFRDRMMVIATRP